MPPSTSQTAGAASRFSASALDGIAPVPGTPLDAQRRLEEWMRRARLNIKAGLETPAPVVPDWDSCESFVDRIAEKQEVLGAGGQIDSGMKTHAPAPGSALDGVVSVPGTPLDAQRGLEEWMRRARRNIKSGLETPAPVVPDWDSCESFVDRIAEKQEVLGAGGQIDSGMKTRAPAPGSALDGVVPVPGPPLDAQEGQEDD